MKKLSKAVRKDIGELDTILTTISEQLMERDDEDNLHTFLELIEDMQNEITNIQEIQGWI